MTTTEPYTLTLKIQLHRPNAGKRAALNRAREVFRQACGWYAAEMLQRGTTGLRSLHALYPAACAAFLELPPATVQGAQAKAAAAVRACQSLRNQGRQPSTPSFSRPLPLHVRRDYYTLERTERGTWVLRLAALRGRPRIPLPLRVSAYHAGRLADVSAGKAVRGTVEVWEDGAGRWWAAVVLTYQRERQPAGAYVGADLGLVNFVVTSQGTFISGGPIRWRMEATARRRAGLQRAGRLARLRREAPRQRNWLRNLIHQTTRRIVDQAASAGQGVALEQLTGIRQRIRGSPSFNRAVHRSWPFAQFAAQITYKAAEAGLPVRIVDARYTSQRCPRCAHTERANRPTRSRFHCRRCGYQLDADLAAARNIAARAEAAERNEAPKELEAAEKDQAGGA